MNVLLPIFEMNPLKFAVGIAIAWMAVSQKAGSVVDESYHDLLFAPHVDSLFSTSERATIKYVSPFSKTRRISRC